MSEPLIKLTPSQLHDIIGPMYMLGCDVPLELATSTLLHSAEEVRLISAAIGAPNFILETDAVNVLHLVARRMETMAKLCDDMARAERATVDAQQDEVPNG